MEHVTERPTSERSLGPAELAAARSLAYGLLADLLARGVTPETRMAALTSDALRHAIFTHAGDLNALAVEHEHAFGWSVPPFEGAFLEPTRSIGVGTGALYSVFAEAGFAADTRSEDLEHLAVALRCLAFLSGAEADAIEDMHLGALGRVRVSTQRVLDRHVLRWFPAFACAVRRTGLVFPTAVVDELEPLLLMQRSELSERVPSFELPEPPALLDREETSLRDIAELLATPAHSGLVLGKHDLARLGRQLHIPRGFGDRVQILVNLVRSAAQYDDFDLVLDALDAEVEAQRGALESPRYAPIVPMIAPWRMRLARTSALLGRMRHDLADIVRRDGEELA